MVDSGAIQSGEKLPATRELAGHLGLNRTTVSAAYAVLEQSGILEGHVGRGSFIAKIARPQRTERTDWESLLPPLERVTAPTPKIRISFANSRPAQDAFPLASFRRLAKDVVDGPDAGADSPAWLAPWSSTAPPLPDRASACVRDCPRERRSHHYQWLPASARSFGAFVFWRKSRLGQRRGDGRSDVPRFGAGFLARGSQRAWRFRWTQKASILR